MLIATLLGLPALGWFLIAFGVTSVAAGALIGTCIRGPETPVFEVPAEPESPVDLDDWLADMAVEFDFELWKRPTASTTSGRAG